MNAKPHIRHRLAAGVRVLLLITIVAAGWPTYSLAQHWVEVRQGGVPVPLSADGRATLKPMPFEIVPESGFTMFLATTDPDVMKIFDKVVRPGHILFLDGSGIAWDGETFPLVKKSDFGNLISAGKTISYVNIHEIAERENRRDGISLSKFAKFREQLAKYGVSDTVYPDIYLFPMYDPTLTVDQFWGGTEMKRMRGRLTFYLFQSLLSGLLPMEGNLGFSLLKVDRLQFEVSR